MSENNPGLAEFLSTRAIIQPKSCALIPPEGRVNNVIPGFQGCHTSILASPKIGAGFVWYQVFVQPEGGCGQWFDEQEGIECFLFCLKGQGRGQVKGQDEVSLESGSYLYAPPGAGLSFKNNYKMRAGEPTVLTVG
jgi:(S)-ureidoglycine aminohydrolase